MKHTVQAISLACLIAGSTLLLASCALLVPQRLDVAAKRIPSDGSSRHIVQTGFGNMAMYGVCADPACPAISQKTLAIVADDRTAPPQDTGGFAAPALPPKIPTQSSAAIEASSKPAAHAATRDHHVIVRFMSGSDLLAQSGKNTLDQALHLALKASRIVIHGRTDSVGPNAPNQALALARALSVRDYLREREPTIPADMILDAKGHCCFVASNDTPKGRQQNRRVEIVFSVPERVAP
ncbi:OmpA family protein [Undibacterium sp. Jales W-56]|uniref:OmpA family protein n=1 Tax=Undibacterium sp. Jales W-56 TaxID=2897325 RepID=UPI0021D1128C|nr:OmpA family protein [Undibacterium sp. Jales W-56]MCU6435333.1 OmpA family protein [Undibacterium sp. Jales W-56]